MSIKTLIISMFVCMLPMSVLASSTQYIDAGKTPQKYQQSLCAHGYVLSIGEPEHSDYLVTTGTGSDVPLTNAIKAHVPNDWNIKFVRKGLQNTLVGWKSDSLWYKWLAREAYEQGLIIVIDYKHHQLYIDRN